MANGSDEIVLMIKKKLEEKNHRIQSLEVQVEALKRELDRLRSENASHKGLLDTLHKVLSEEESSAGA